MLSMLLRGLILQKTWCFPMPMNSNLFPVMLPKLLVPWIGLLLVTVFLVPQMLSLLLKLKKPVLSMLPRPRRTACLMLRKLKKLVLIILLKLRQIELSKRGCLILLIRELLLIWLQLVLTPILHILRAERQALRDLLLLRVPQAEARQARHRLQVGARIFLMLSSHFLPTRSIVRTPFINDDDD